MRTAPADPSARRPQRVANGTAVVAAQARGDALDVTGSSLAQVIESERRFISAVNYRGGRRALTGHGLGNQRVYIPGMAPAIGRALGAMAYGMFLDDTLAMDLLKLEFQGGDLAESGEFAYTYGIMSSENSSFRTNYLRLWRYTTEGQWKIAVEVLKPF